MQTGKGKDRETIAGLNWTVFHCSSEQLHNRTDDGVYSFIVSGTKKLLLISTYNNPKQGLTSIGWHCQCLLGWMGARKWDLWITIQWEMGI